MEVFNCKCCNLSFASLAPKKGEMESYNRANFKNANNIERFD